MLEIYSSSAVLPFGTTNQPSHATLQCYLLAWFELYHIIVTTIGLCVNQYNEQINHKHYLYLYAFGSKLNVVFSNSQNVFKAFGEVICHCCELKNMTQVQKLFAPTKK